MILDCVSHIATQLNMYLKHSFELSEDIVMVSNLMEHDGSMVAATDNRLTVFLANIEKDTMAAQKGRTTAVVAGRDVVKPKPIFLNLYVMIVANFSGANYSEGLKFISSVIGFFQQQAVFNHQNSPDLPNQIEKIILDIENMKNSELSHLWGLYGAKYLPSVLYKVRMVLI